MLENVSINTHSSIKITTKDNKNIYFDPFKIPEDINDADYIFITHSHYDHFSPEDIQKIKKDSSKIIVKTDLFDKAVALGFNEDNVLIALPNAHYAIDSLEFDTIPAYNKLKIFHPRKNGWIGYIIKLDDITYYIAGDTDYSYESALVKCDVAFLPVGGTYTMNHKEAAKLANVIRPKIAVPTHYGSIVGSPEDGDNFAKLLYKEIECVKLINF